MSLVGGRLRRDTGLFTRTRLETKNEDEKIGRKTELMGQGQCNQPKDKEFVYHEERWGPGNVTDNGDDPHNTGDYKRTGRRTLSLKSSLR